MKVISLFLFVIFLTSCNDEYVEILESRLDERGAQLEIIQEDIDKLKSILENIESSVSNLEVDLNYIGDVEDIKDAVYKIRQVAEKIEIDAME